MSKEFEKFKATFKTLEPDARMYSAEKVGNEAKAYSLRAGDISVSGEGHLSDSMVVARKNGVTGKALADFMKDAGFKDAMAVYRKAMAGLAKMQADLLDSCKGAATALAQFEKLGTAMAKDLKARSGKSESKKEIEALQTEVAAIVKDLKKAAGAFAALPQLRREYPDKIDANIERILKKAPEAQAISRENTVLPQLMVDRNMTMAKKKALAHLKRINDGCAHALDLAAADNAKGAQAALKDAATELEALKKIDDEFRTVISRYKGDIAVAKNKAAILKTAADVAKAHDLAESKLRGAATTIKKAAA